MYQIVLFIFLVFLALTSCSTTRNLPEGEILYTGQKKMRIENLSKTPDGLIAMEEIEAALATPPNNSFLGNNYRWPVYLPVGLWAYNNSIKTKGLIRWTFNKFATQPVLISAINPDVRTKVASNLLHDYGYFTGAVTYTLLQKEKSRKAKLRYTVNMGEPYTFDSIMYGRFSPDIQELLLTGKRASILRKGDQFSVIRLDEERSRLSSILRNRGYYYFRPDFIAYLADTTRISNKVDLQIVPNAGLPPAALRQWRIGDIDVRLYGVDGEIPNDTLRYKNMLIHYSDKLKVRPDILWRSFRFESGQLFSEMRNTRTHDHFVELGIFRYTEIQYTPRDSTGISNILDVAVRANYDLPYDSELELNIATKSNDQAGPGAAYSVTKRNTFGGGETFSLRFRGSYEWQTNSPVTASGSTLNSYELGASASLTFPRVVFPKIGKHEYDFPANTVFRLNADLLNRAHFFKMLSFGGEATYTFQPSSMNRHVLTPFKLIFNTLQQTTEEFDRIAVDNPILSRSLSDQFIPTTSYTYTYDNTTFRRRKNALRLEVSFTSAGNGVSLIYKLFGKDFSQQKELLGTHFAQFLKLTGDIRYTWIIDRNQSIATRLNGGLIYAYGNSDVPPYSEQFFVGGANSIRAFTVRSIGPGNYKPEMRSQSNYSYMDQTGDIKLEGNIEYRFRIINDIHGAVFADTGNIWMLRSDPDRPGGTFNLKRLPQEMALGTGVGLRYDLSVMVIRFDCGIAIHTPYETTRKGYYNIPKFANGLGLHFAIGYPF
ncbi:Translocation and assembly module TamA [termite gut metagenome]|uniref:Translocation and assembly module TamA n=1 Tax=termite gut metagenome TaxID=433724 RepID=A0A5J4T2K0_9ZZZZ